VFNIPHSWDHHQPNLITQINGIPPPNDAIKVKQGCVADGQIDKCIIAAVYRASFQPGERGEGAIGAPIASVSSLT
jgi:hypothetical protein